MGAPPLFPEATTPDPAIRRALPSPPASEPRTSDDLVAALANPLHAIEVVLATPERSRANLEERSALAPLVVLFLVVAAAWSIPFGIVLGFAAWWKIGVLTLGSMAICLPSLHVFAAFLGLRTTPLTITALASTLPATTALFTAGFAPILWFLRMTFDATSHDVTWVGLAQCLLAAALVAGVIQLLRTLPRAGDGRGIGVLALLMPCWLLVFGYVLVRMVRVLDLFA